MEIESYNLIRILIVMISGLSIYFGYQLFKSVTERQGKLKIAGNNTSLELGDVGPGIYFSLFGSIVLVAVLWTQPYKETTSTSSAASSYRESGEFTTTSREPASAESENESNIKMYLDGACIKEEMKEHFESGMVFLAYLEVVTQNQQFAQPDNELIHELKRLLSKNISGVTYVPFTDNLHTNLNVKYAAISYLIAYSVANQCTH